MATLRDVGEFPFIESIARLARRGGRGGVRVGIGDDAALVDAGASTVVTTDTQRERVHFRRDWLSAAELGRRAFRVAVSDVAAMGALPRYVLLSFGAPPDLEVRWARSAIGALIAEARHCDSALVGGNVSHDDAVSFVVTIIASASVKPPLRSGARAGETLWVTGTLGGAAAGVELLTSGVRSGSLVAAYRKPPLRVPLAHALVRAGFCGAMIDVSDGLLGDLAHVCRASGVSARLDLEAIPLAPGLRTRVPRAARGLGTRAARPVGRRRPRAAGATPRRAPLDYALGGGDDYELLFTLRGAGRENRLTSLCAKHGCMVSRIGTIVRAQRDVQVLSTDGKALDARGYAHFARLSDRSSR